ncbi:metalloregulator ArsR/SmtB family transcription factor [Lentzea sp. NPDC042327]|uniref:ArsR/SmtB family transcription factor n=1 Tax=Lentzea sp. NPDC042327 TaxID=3154801 RepID=UPI0033DA2907
METEEGPARGDITIEAVLAALDHPLRLRVVRTLAAAEELNCQEILPDITKSTASHHWKVLREAGVVEQRREGRYLYLRLRREDLDSRFPGVLDAVVRG